MTHEETMFRAACAALLVAGVDGDIAAEVCKYGESAITAAVQAQRVKDAGIARYWGNSAMDEEADDMASGIADAIENGKGNHND